jgi:hypothetical protein
MIGEKLHRNPWQKLPRSFDKRQAQGLAEFTARGSDRSLCDGVHDVFVYHKDNGLMPVAMVPVVDQRLCNLHCAIILRVSG